LLIVEGSQICSKESKVSYRILVIDDEPDFRNTLSGVLRDAEYTVRSAANEGEAWEAVTQESFDFALIDMRLHGDSEEDESGLSLAMALHLLNPKVCVILLSGYYTRIRQIVRAVRYYGVVDFIEKGPGFDALVLQALEEACKEAEGTGD
jgi:DNA-binding NtrC family response regulator